MVAGDGLNSATRSKYADSFRPVLDVRRSKYMWLGTTKVFEAFTFDVRRTPYGVVQVHAYPYDAGGSTFIVEMHDSVWRRAGFDRSAARVFAPGESDSESVAGIGELLGDLLDGHPLLANNSRWITFTTVRCESWRHGNVVLLGDAAHTAHFSIGSGTKLAMEDALALAASLHEHPTVDRALAAYDAERRPVVLSTQRAAQASLEWFENLGQYVHQEPPQFAFNLLTRSRRVTHDNLRLRDPEFVAGVDGWFARAAAGRAGSPQATDAPPMFQPLRLRGLELANRVVVSPMDMYSAVDGDPTDFHLVHLGGKALGGAGLVMTEMVCVSPTGRITPGCTGLYSDEQEAGVPADRRLRARQLRRRDRPAARPLRPQGVDPADVGGHRRAAAGGQLGGLRALRAAVLPAPTRCRASSPAPRWRRSGTSSSTPPGGALGPASTCSSCTARTATCSRPSCRR